MKKYFGPLILCTLIGSFMGIFLINQYKSSNVMQTFNESKAYFLKLGIYDNKESMKEATSDFSYYIYQEKDSKFHAYIAITKSEQNKEKLKGFFNLKGYTITEEEIPVQNEAFLIILDQYDELLSKTEDEKTIKAICSQVLSKYEEVSSENQTNTSGNEA